MPDSFKLKKIQRTSEESVPEKRLSPIRLERYVTRKDSLSSHEILVIESYIEHDPFTKQQYESLLAENKKH